jgi:hypothetical protein
VPNVSLPPVIHTCGPWRRNLSILSFWITFCTLPMSRIVWWIVFCVSNPLFVFPKLISYLRRCITSEDHGDNHVMSPSFPHHHSDCATIRTARLSVDHVGIQIRLYFLFLSDIIILYVLFLKLSMDIPRALVITIVRHFLYFPILSSLCSFLLSTSFLA